jgi:uncharacterized damage-inducible protein DinB
MPAADGDHLARFEGADLSGARFERADLSRARFRLVNLTGVRLDQVLLSGAVMRGVELVDVDIDGEVSNVVINGVEVGPLIEAELDRRHPDRAKMHPTEPAGFRDAWDIVERLWDGTVTRARGLDPALLHESVDGEWSFVQTLRHLVFATDAWIRRAVLGHPRPWHPLDLPHDTFSELPGVPRDREARPSLDDVLVLRADRMATVRQVVEDLTEEQLDSHTEPVTEPGYPPSQSYPVRECLLIILSEEWHHRMYAERDLDALESGARAERDTAAARVRDRRTLHGDLRARAVQRANTPLHHRCRSRRL